MSKGLGNLQRRILRHLGDRRRQHRRGTNFIAVDVFGKMLVSQLTNAEIASTRRALLGLKRRGLVVDEGRLGWWTRQHEWGPTAG